VLAKRVGSDGVMGLWWGIMRERGKRAKERKKENNEGRE
jgi:hypothetical protein